MTTTSYLNNPKLKRHGVQINFSKAEVSEYIKCANNYEYFFDKYIKIVHTDLGLIPFKLRPYQKNMIKTFEDNRFVICKLPRQYGKSTTVAGYILWLVLFKPYFVIGILAHKVELAREILGKIQLAYENIPLWMQQGIIEWNKGTIELENGSKIICQATSASAARGYAFNLIYLDEFAFVHNNIAETFFTSAFPTISSGKTTKMIITSTPRGMNYFHQLWEDAINKRSGFVPVDAHWSDIPGRDEKWRKEQIDQLGSVEKFDQEFGCEFIGSSNTLIHPNILRRLMEHGIIDAVRYRNNLKIYHEPDKAATYIATVDTGFGTEGNYSVTTVFRVDKIPYEVVAIYRNNTVNTILYPHIIHDILKEYNNAYVLIEVNSVGKEISDILMYEIEYENILTTQTRGRNGTILGGSFGKDLKYGLDMNKRSKAIGCSNLRTLIESNKLVINDKDFVKELTNFIRYPNGTFKADEGETDDVVMTGVMFAWLTTEEYFKELTDSNIVKKMHDDNQSAFEDILPFYKMTGGPEEEDTNW